MIFKFEFFTETRININYNNNNTNFESRIVGVYFKNVKRQALSLAVNLVKIKFKKKCIIIISISYPPTIKWFTNDFVKCM